MLNAYQRGNRDGLLAFADRLEANAKVYEETADKYEAKLNAGRFANSPTHRNVVTLDRQRAQQLREIAADARRASDAIPLDPENPEEDE